MTWEKKFKFEIKDTPAQMEQTVRNYHTNENATVRLLSSYSVEWKTKGMLPESKQNLPANKKDFYISNGDGTYFSRCWNTPNEFVAPLTNDTMIDDPLCEVGYPQEIRGWDFSYFGILWLDDVIWRNNRWQINMEHISFDRGIASKRTAVTKKHSKNLRFIYMGMSPEIDKLCITMFNIYRVLLTRAIKGNVLYVKDKETREYLRSLLA